jgi:quercetin dioxygenase-like cupin family protein
MADAEATPSIRHAVPTVVQPGAGRTLDFGADGVASVMLGGEQTGGALTAILVTGMPDTGPPPHVHANEDEFFLVVEGRISYLAEGCWTDVGPGGVVFFPRGTLHCYRHLGTTPSRHWLLTTPAGFERFFARFAEEVTRAGGPDMRRIADMSLGCGITYPGAE